MKKTYVPMSVKDLGEFRALTTGSGPTNADGQSGSGAEGVAGAGGKGGTGGTGFVTR